VTGDPQRLSTGVEVLDWTLDGGVPTGSLVALCAEADSQSHLLVAAVASAAPTTYFSTYRPAGDVRVDDDVDVRTLDADELRDDPDCIAAAVPEAGYVVVDRIDDVETLGADALQSVLDPLVAACRSQNAVALVHCLGDGDTPERSLSLARSDLVMRLVTTVTSMSIDHRLVVTKFRGGRAPTEPIKLELTDHVSVDTSRDIA
jgi:DNA repair protein RadA/Sms